MALELFWIPLPFVYILFHGVMFLGFVSYGTVGCGVMRHGMLRYSIPCLTALHHTGLIISDISKLSITISRQNLQCFSLPTPLHPAASILRCHLPGFLVASAIRYFSISSCLLSFWDWYCGTSSYIPTIPQRVSCLRPYPKPLLSKPPCPHT